MPRNSGPVAVLAALVAVAGLAAALLVPRNPSEATTVVVVNGRSVAAPGTRPTVGTALAAAHVPYRPALVLSVATRRDLGRRPPPVLVDGRPADLATVLGGGDRVEVATAPTVTEPVSSRRLVGADAGLPDVENSLWRPGRPATDREQVGELSGEVIRPPAPASGRPETDKVVALTFDDGPDPRWTPTVLAVLAEERVPATFCLTGNAAARHPELALAEVAQGETICNHTATHDQKLDREPHDRVVAEVGTGADLVRSAAGVDPGFYRPPGGHLSPDIVASAHALGERVLTWSVDPLDWQRPPAAVILSRVLARVGPGAVILLHDGGDDRSQTVAALGPLIQALKAQGYGFTTPALVPQA